MNAFYYFLFLKIMLNKQQMIAKIIPIANRAVATEKALMCNGLMIITGVPSGGMPSMQIICIYLD